MSDTVWVRHLKRGSIYKVLPRDGEVQSKRPIREGDKLVTYIGQDGRVWHRPPEEFDDGRFQQLEPHEIPAGTEDELKRFVRQVANLQAFTDNELDEIDIGGEALTLRSLIEQARDILDKRASSAGNALQASQSVGSKSRTIF